MVNFAGNRRMRWYRGSIGLVWPRCRSISGTNPIDPVYKDCPSFSRERLWTDNSREEGSPEWADFSHSGISQLEKLRTLVRAFG